MNTSTGAGALVLASPHPAPALLWTPVAGRPLLAWSVAACAQTPALTDILLLVPAGEVDAARALAAAKGWARVRVVPGGTRVRDSVEAGLRALDPALAWVVVHEAARPLASPALLAAALELAQRANTDIITGEPVKETVKRLRDGLVAETLPRERMVRAQTPQVYQRARLQAAHAAQPPERDFPDEVALALADGLSLRVFPGSPDNIRVTSAADIAVAEALLAGRREWR